ncbi:MAG: hypothetical protein Q8R55_00375 [Candidatus Taylorbacteria bacterium]|nr:hypothetical protein [Candidatus Taylorbacteria bacterium]
MRNSTHYLRIHGDNILECENALKLLSFSLNGKEDYKIVDGSPAYAPIYSIETNHQIRFLIQLFPGYGRWRFSITDYLIARGAPLREAPDAIITKFDAKQNYEYPTLAFEFSGALPAGNNAWQRTGRALALAYAGIPYLYFTELGGYELGSDRALKAPRFPNPLVPFAYATLGIETKTISLPVYIPSPSISAGVAGKFSAILGYQDAADLVKAILLGSDCESSKGKLEKKLIEMVEILAKQRKRNDTLEPVEWKTFYNKKSGSEKADWLISRKLSWNKKLGIKSLTKTFLKLLKLMNKNKVVAIGSKEMPICLVSRDRRPTLANDIKKLYGDRVSNEFIRWLANSNRHLVFVWIAGFKPRGDDSRPDRGLVPLARMVLGTKDLDLLSIVYGPAKSKVWNQLQSDMKRLASINGLWETIVNLSDGILIDSHTSKKVKNIGFINQKVKTEPKEIPLIAASTTPTFGEHDIDSVMHLLFSEAIQGGVYEALCNPPGGDWSGINVFDFKGNIEFRWTSLPRVSGADSKRPDHLVQIRDGSFLLSIESKDIQARLEKNVGPRLIKYVNQLLRNDPISTRTKKEKWLPFSGTVFERKFHTLSAVAFRVQNPKDLGLAIKNTRADIAFGLNFKSNDGIRTVIHILMTEKAKPLAGVIKKLASRYPKSIELKFY